MTFERKEQIVDVVKDFLGWIVVSAVAFVWWLLMLLIVSMILMNVVKFTFMGILRWSTILAAICSVAWLVRIIYRRFATNKN